MWGGASFTDFVDVLHKKGTVSQENSVRKPKEKRKIKAAAFTKTLFSASETNISETSDVFQH